MESMLASLFVNLGCRTLLPLTGCSIATFDGTYSLANCRSYHFLCSFPCLLIILFATFLQYLGYDLLHDCLNCEVVLNFGFKIQLSNCRFEKAFQLFFGDTKFLLASVILFPLLNKGSPALKEMLVFLCGLCAG